MCKPLSEDEFHDAIEDNYYTPNKFNFGLSYEQVCKLINLFSRKKIARLMYSTSKNDHALRENCPVGSSFDLNEHRMVPGSGDEHSSFSPGMVYPFSTQEHAACARSFLDTQNPLFRGRMNSSSLDIMMPSLPSTNKHSLSGNGSYGNFKGPSTPTDGPPRVTVPLIGSENQADTFPERYDPSPMFSILTPNLIANKVTDSLPSVHVPSYADVHYEASQCGDGSGGQHYFDFGPSADYIPRSEDLAKETEYSHISGIAQKYERDTQYRYSSESGDHYRQSIYDEIHPIASKSKLHSDQARTSVFSRLSKMSEPHAQYEKAHRPDTDPSLQQLVEILSQRRDQWSDNTIVQELPVVVWGDDKQIDGITELEPSAVASLGEPEPSCEEIIEECTAFPFLDFKRRSRSGARRMKSETERTSYVDGGEDGGSLGKYKRRKLVRPSFRESLHAHDLPQEIGEAEAFVKNDQRRIAKTCASSAVRSNEEGGHSNSSKASLDNLASDGSVRNISSETAKWMMLKAMLNQEKAPVEGHSEDLGVRSSQASSLPTHCDNGDQEAGGADKLHVASPVDDKIGGSEDYLPL